MAISGPATKNIRGHRRNDGKIVFGRKPLAVAVQPYVPPAQIAGWTDMKTLLVTSDGSYSLGNPLDTPNNTRDQGSKILFFDVVDGDNATADYYWWNGTNIIDSQGRTANPDNSEVYGTDPLHPNEAAINAYASYTSTEADDGRLVTHHVYTGDFRQTGAAASYPDWFLFKRGQEHVDFNVKTQRQGVTLISGGRSESEPMVVAAYGNDGDGRAIVGSVASGNPLTANPSGESVWQHVFFRSLEFTTPWGISDAQSAGPKGGPTTAWLEDCRFNNVKTTATGLARKSTMYRSILRFGWNDVGHSQAYYSDGAERQALFDSVILYRNGFKENPMLHADPVRDVFCRNIYQGGGAKMGFTYWNIISADGASGGPQMRYGGLMENSLIVEGYFYSSTYSNTPHNDWMLAEGQVGQSAAVKNNVQFIYMLDTPNDPGNPNSQANAHPGYGYAIKASTFGADISSNIISGAMLEDDLGGEAVNGFTVEFNSIVYEDGNSYPQKNNRITENIIYRAGMQGFVVSGDSTGATNNVVSDNAIVDKTFALSSGGVSNLTTSDQLLFKNNRFYSEATSFPTNVPGLDGTNTLDSVDKAADTEGWSDPDRTLKRYVVEVLGLTILDWADDPWCDSAEAQLRIDAGEAYDPTGLKTFMAVASNMRYGGAQVAPTSGKPNWEGDYAWSKDFEGEAVVNWIREGFGLPSVSVTIN